MNGWQGWVLRVDLSTGSMREEPLEADLAERFLGGRGFGVYWMFREALRVDPLGPDNLLVLATGPLTGTKAPSAGRFTAVSRSPLTGTVFDGSSSGAFGPRLKGCGYDALIIRGQTSSPSCLYVEPGKARLEEAGRLWGQDTQTACRWLRAAAGPNSSVLAIGPAGEQGVPYATASVDGGGQFGRGGLGAVMGSKGLKAVVVAGNEPVRVADPARFDFVLHEMDKVLEANPLTSLALPQFGTAFLVNLLNRAGSLPTRNFRSGQFEEAGAVSGERLRSSFLERCSACHGCSIGCGRVVRLDGLLVEGPDYESIGALGPNLGISDLESLIRAYSLCNRYGLDSVSTAGTLACAMELADRGLGSGFPSFGNSREVLNLIPQIARRTGQGEMLAAGARHLARSLGAPELAMQVKGMELPAYDPRGMQGQGLGFATSNQGGCHSRGNMVAMEILGSPKMVSRWESVGKAGLLINLQHNHAVLDSLVLCKLTALALSEEHYSRLLRFATGQVWRTQDLIRIGERIWNLERIYNIENGFTTADDSLPVRLLEEPAQGRPVNLKGMLGEYYRFRNWSEEGRPSPAKLDELGLSNLGGKGEQPGHVPGV